MLWVLGYLLIAGAMARLAARWMLNNLEENHPILVRTEEDYKKESVECWAFGSLLAIIWPGTLALYLITKMFKLVFGTKFFYIDTPRRKKIREGE